MSLWGQKYAQGLLSVAFQSYSVAFRSLCGNLGSFRTMSAYKLTAHHDYSELNL